MRYVLESLGASVVEAADFTERVGIAGEARKRVFELRELDVQPRLAGVGALGKDIEDDLRAIDDDLMLALYKLVAARAIARVAAREVRDVHAVEPLRE